MLRRELVSPRRRRQLARTIGTWSFGAIVVGAALVDTTILAKEPRSDRANVDLDERHAATPVEVEVEPVEVMTQPQGTPLGNERKSYTWGDADDQPIATIVWLTAEDPRPDNRFALDGGIYTLRIAPSPMNVNVELSAPGCEVRSLVLSSDHDGGARMMNLTDELPLRLSLTPAQYDFNTVCAGTRTITRFRVERVPLP
jgi:hypothetical protein